MGRPEPQDWYFFKAGSDAGLKAGPFSWERLVEQVQTGVLEPNDVVWDPGSGWKKAVQVPGLFPDIAPDKLAGTFSSPLPLEAPTQGRGRSRLYWVSGLVALVVIGVGLGVYFGFFYGAGDDTDATTPGTAVQSTTTLSGTSLGSTTTSGSVTTTTASDGGADSPYVVYLDKEDFGRELRVRVGDHVRIDLKPYVGDRVNLVTWRFTPLVVREVDSGSEVISDVVVSAWLELEAVVAGPVTVRAEYHYPSGPLQTTWVAYLIVVE